MGSVVAEAEQHDDKGGCTDDLAWAVGGDSDGSPESIYSFCSDLPTCNLCTFVPESDDKHRYGSLPNFLLQLPHRIRKNHSRSN